MALPSVASPVRVLLGVTARVCCSMDPHPSVAAQHMADPPETRVD